MARVVARAGSTRADLLTGTCVDDVGLASPAIVGCILAVAGASIRVWCYRALGRLFTFELLLLPHHKLVTSGPYAIVRHPSYMGAILVLGGTLLVHGARGALTHECPVACYLWTIFWSLLMAISCAMTVDQCTREDRVLHSAFGREWEAWSGRVRWRLVPWVY